MGTGPHRRHRHAVQRATGSFAILFSTLPYPFYNVVGTFEQYLYVVNDPYSSRSMLWWPEGPRSSPNTRRGSGISHKVGLSVVATGEDADGVS